MKTISFFLLLLIVVNAFSQQQKEQIFTIDDFIQQIKQYHPIAKQANIQVKKAQADLLSAKGRFDPVLNIDISRKTFDGKNYYNYSNPEIKIYTPSAIGIRAGVESNGGIYTNPEVTKGNTSYLGIEIALAKGLIIDERRAALQQSKMYVDQSEQEKISILNDLLFNAYVTYWQWAASYQLYNIYSQYVLVANKRLQLVKTAYVNGDRSMMDTTEAFAQVQNYQLQQAEALLKLNNAAIELSSYLWQENDGAVNLPLYYKPDTKLFLTDKQVEEIEVLINRSDLENPVIKGYQSKLNILQIEQKLKFQKLLPYINLKANLLNKGYYVLKGVDAALLQNNYKWGIDFNLPLFQREGRGEYKKAQLKLREVQIDFSNKKWQIENKIRSYYNEYRFLQEQLRIMQEMYNNYTALLRNEELKFTQGESSLFLVNSRETKVIEIMQKQIETRFKYLKSVHAIQWVAGMLK